MRSNFSESALARLREQRGWADHVLRLARHIDWPDRALLDAVYGRGLSATAVAHAAGRSPRAVRNRLTRLVKRLSSPEFHFVLREKQHWPLERRRIADLVILRGRSQREAAAELGVTIHRVRRELERLRALHEAAMNEHEPTRAAG